MYDIARVLAKGNVSVRTVKNDYVNQFESDWTVGLQQYVNAYLAIATDFLFFIFKFGFKKIYILCKNLLDIKFDY